MTDTRTCEQCGADFTPRREHARFCSARCRVAWNRQHVGDPPAEAGALGWTIAAMRDTTDRLRRARTADPSHGFAAISETVWWITLVDATMVRYHPDVYDGLLGRHDESERLIIEGTFGGLRFVRNWMGYHLDHSDFVQPGSGSGKPGSGKAGSGKAGSGKAGLGEAGSVPLAAWTWRPLAAPVLGELSARGQEWEMTRYRDYQAQLAGRPVGEAFQRAVDFLLLAAEGSSTAK